MTQPPLPTPPAATLADPDGQTLALFTEAQLLAYRDACIEMCAKVCDNIVIQTVGHSAATADQIAEELRGLK